MRPMTADELINRVLITRIKDNDENVRADAWLNAGPFGEVAVKPLADLMSYEHAEVARAAKRALWKIVRHAGRPGADNEKQAVAAALIPLLGNDQPRHVRVETLWMLSEIAGDGAVKPVAALLANEDLREDARLVLQRIPGEESLAALKTALTTATDDFKLNLVQSLRQRGVEVPAMPCRKLTPVRQTKVKPVGR